MARKKRKPIDEYKSESFGYMEKVREYEQKIIQTRSEYYQAVSDYNSFCYQMQKQFEKQREMDERREKENDP